jgi:hypothetical protein
MLYIFQATILPPFLASITIILNNTKGKKIKFVAFKKSWEVDKDKVDEMWLQDDQIGSFCDHWGNVVTEKFLPKVFLSLCVRSFSNQSFSWCNFPK